MRENFKFGILHLPVLKIAHLKCFQLEQSSSYEETEAADTHKIPHQSCDEANSIRRLCFHFTMPGSTFRVMFAVPSYL